MLNDDDNRIIVGINIVAPNAAEMIQGLAVAMTASKNPHGDGDGIPMHIFEDVFFQ